MSIYERIKYLCHKNNISISKLETELKFGNSSIKKWERCSSPSIDKVQKVAEFFHVSTDYLLCRSDIETPLSDIIEDADIISLQRAREKMTPQDKDKMMKMLRIGFEYAFQEDDA